MAIIITQEPISPNVSYTKLMYVASGSGTTSNPQYKYVVDVFESGSTTRLARLKTPANPDGVGVFDVSSIIQDDLGYDENWYHPGVISNVSASRLFQLKFGEEYAASESGSVEIYDGEGSLGDPSVTSSVALIFKGIVDPTIYNSYNFNQDPFDTGSMGYDEGRGPRLSDSPFGYSEQQDIISLSDSDYHTISVLGQLDSGYRFLAASCSVEYAEFIPSQSFGFAQYGLFTPNDIVTIGCGPNNFRSSSIAEVSSSFTGSWAAYVVDLIYTGSGGQISSSYYFGNDEYNLGGFYVDAEPLTTFITQGGLINCRSNLLGFGDVNDAMAAGGLFSGSGPYQEGTEKWNGTTWALAANMIKKRANGVGGGGVQAFGNSADSGIVNGGFSDGAPIGEDESYTCEEYDGVGWTLIANMNNARMNGSSIGTVGAGLTVGGLFQDGMTTASEAYNGTVWTNGPAMPVGKVRMAGAGTYSDGLFWGSGPVASPPAPPGENNNTLLWNGSTWTLDAPLPTPPFDPEDNLIGAGAGNDASGAGGYFNVLTQHWNGTTWVAGSNFIQWVAGAAAGNTGDVLFYGGKWGVSQETCIPQQVYSALGSRLLPYDLKQSPTTYPVCYPPTKFAFINNYGVWDYVQIIYPINKVTDLKRESVSLPNANYSDTTSIYDISKRGKTTYYTKPKSKYNITTGYLPQGEADWWPQLIESPSVFIQENGTFVGIIVTNKSYKHKTNPKGQKVFQYKIEFEYANNDRARI